MSRHATAVEHYTGRPGDESAFVPFNPARYMTDVAQKIQDLSIQEWGGRRAVTVVGHSGPLAEMLRKVQRLAAFEEPVLITGESGSGKESLAQAIYLLRPRRGSPLVIAN